MTRKGKLAEIFSKAMHADDPRTYFVSYRDFQTIVEVPLDEFMRLSENMQIIPPGRILSIRKGTKVLYQKFTQN